MFIKAGEGEVCVHSTTIRNEPSKESLPNIMLIERLLKQGPRRGRGWGGALAPPLICKNKNKLNKK